MRRRPSHCKKGPEIFGVEKMEGRLRERQGAGAKHQTDGLWSIRLTCVSVYGREGGRGSIKREREHKEREREKECVCDREIEREYREKECVCEREREREREREGVKKR